MRRFSIIIFLKELRIVIDGRPKLVVAVVQAKIAATLRIKVHTALERLRFDAQTCEGRVVAVIDCDAQGRRLRIADTRNAQREFLGDHGRAGLIHSYTADAAAYQGGAFGIEDGDGAPEVERVVGNVESETGERRTREQVASHNCFPLALLHRITASGTYPYCLRFAEV